MTPDPNIGRCDKPRCKGPPTNTYTDAHGNTLDLCDKHYYEAVTNNGNTTTSPSVGFVGGAVPDDFDPGTTTPGPFPGDDE